MPNKASLHRPLVGAAIIALALLPMAQCATTSSRAEETSRMTKTHGSVDGLRKAIASLCAQFKIPGLTIAVTYQERLMYTDALGYANQERKEPLSTSSLFRIASISKVITEIAILKLADENILELEDTVFGGMGILGDSYGIPPKGSQIEKITVRNLIDHKSGWTNNPNDPMFNYPGVSQKDLITQMVTKRKLISAPGSTYYYLNFGYCVLGRVIEKVTGQTYESYVQEHILAPCGITDMRIARNSFAERLPGEVKYYQAEFSPYSLDLLRMDSHGGWIGSTIDLANFMCRIDQGPRVQDILPSSRMAGTYLSYDNWWFSGSLSGTTSIVSRFNSDVNYVVLANTRTERDPDQIIEAIRRTVSSELEKIKDWP